MKRQFIIFLLAVAWSTPVLAGLKEAIAAMDREDYQTAYKEFSALAEKGDAQAMISVALLYHQGQGFKQDYGQAMEWYLKAFKKQNGDAYNNIGVLYRDGLGVEKNLEVAYALFWIAYWRGLGSDATQMRIGRNVEKISALISKQQIEQALKMTEPFVVAFVEKKGKPGEKEAVLKFSTNYPAIKSLGDLQGSSGPVESCNFVCEIRIPKEHLLAPMAKIDLVTEDGMSGAPISMLKKREENGVTIYSFETLVFENQRRAVVLRFPDGPSQVFKLGIPAKPKPADWTAWVRPDYVEAGDASWTFMRNSKSDERSTKIPAETFEFRYRVEKTAAK